METSSEPAYNVNHLFNTNSTPSPEQRNILQNFILEINEAVSNSDKDISDLKEQILALQARITVIENSRAQLIQERTNYSSLLSPLRCLPIELFGKIFVYATQDCARDVLNLSAVCQLWRYAALSTPELWSTLELGHHTAPWNAIYHIESWIERAQSFPLSLIIKMRHPEHFVDPVDYVSTPDYQWKSINLETDSRQSALIFLEDLRRSNLETLESLSLTLHFYDYGLSISDILRLGYMPKLTTLALSFECQPTFDMLPFPWSQLTTLTITFDYSPGLALDILQACVNLEEFTIHVTENGNQLGPIRSIALNHLRKLHTYSFSNHFLHSFKTPSIEDVAIKGSWYKHFSTSDFYYYFQSHGSTLLKLSIAPFSRTLVQCIQYLRSLVELKLYDNNCDDDGSIKTYEVLNPIIVKPQMDPSTIPLPRLKILEIICQATERNQKTFIEVVESRWWSDEEENIRQQGHQSLSRIKYAVLMNVHTELNVFCRKDVDDLRAQGMRIEYLTPFDGMDKDEFHTSRYYSYTSWPPTDNSSN